MQILNGWKEIATYVGVGVRTVQRYECDLALPVRRPRGKQRSAVMAVLEELDMWLRHAPLNIEAQPPRPARISPEILSRRPDERGEPAQLVRGRAEQPRAGR